MGRRRGEVGGGLEGNTPPVAAVFMPPFLGRAAGGARDERGNRLVSEFGAGRETETEYERNRTL